MNVLIHWTTIAMPRQPVLMSKEVTHVFVTLDTGEMVSAATVSINQQTNNVRGHKLCPLKSTCSSMNPGWCTKDSYLSEKLSLGLKLKLCENKFS